MSKLCYALLALLTFVLAGCDSDPAEPPPSESLTYSPIPHGGSLFGGLGKTKTLDEATYGCYVSSPNVGASQAERYLYEGFYLHFPKRVLDAASGRRKIIKLLVSSTTLYAAAEREHAAVMRVARCVVPDAPEATELLVEQAQRFSPDGGADWQGEPAVGASASGTPPPDLTGGGATLSAPNKIVELG